MKRNYANVKIKDVRFNNYVTVPYKYITRKDNKTLVWYMDPSSLTETNESLVEQYIKENTFPPPSDWKTFGCEIIIYTNTYAAAKKHLNGCIFRPWQPMDFGSDTSENSDAHEEVQPTCVIKRKKTCTERNYLQGLHIYKKMNHNENNTSKSVQSYHNILTKRLNITNTPVDPELSFCQKESTQILAVNDIEEFYRNFIENFDKKIELILNKIQELKILIVQYKSLDPNDIVTYEEFTKKFNMFNIPFHSDKDFVNFDLQLQSNHNDLKVDLKKHLNLVIDRKRDAADNVKMILRKFFMPSVLTLYTSQIQRRNKKIFKETQFFQCLYGSIAQAYKKIKEEVITEKEVLTSIGIEFNLIKERNKPSKN